MRALLRTACGSIRIVEMDSFRQLYSIPLPSVFDAEAELKRNQEWVPPEPKVREFIYGGEIPVFDEKVV